MDRSSICEYQMKSWIPSRSSRQISRVSAELEAAWAAGEITVVDGARGDAVGAEEDLVEEEGVAVERIGG